MSINMYPRVEFSDEAALVCLLAGCGRAAQTGLNGCRRFADFTPHLLAALMAFPDNHSPYVTQMLSGLPARRMAPPSGTGVVAGLSVACAELTFRGLAIEFEFRVDHFDRMVLFYAACHEIDNIHVNPTLGDVAEYLVNCVSLPPYFLANNVIKCGLPLLWYLTLIEATQRQSIIRAITDLPITSLRELANADNRLGFESARRVATPPINPRRILQ